MSLNFYYFLYFLIYSHVIFHPSSEVNRGSYPSTVLALSILYHRCLVNIPIAKGSIQEIYLPNTFPMNCKIYPMNIISFVGTLVFRKIEGRFNIIKASSIVYHILVCSPSVITKNDPLMPYF